MHAIYGRYSGDADFASSVSAAVSQVVTKGRTTIVLVSLTNPLNFGQSMSLTASVWARIR